MNPALTFSLPTPELLLWSAAVGAMGLVVLVALADVIYSRTQAAVRALVYLGGCWLFVALFSGLGAAAWPAALATLAIAQVLAGPICSAYGSYWCHVWLSAQKRDRLMTTSLLGMTAVCISGGPLCLLLEPAWRLPASATISVATLCVSLWHSVRAAQLGDKLAWGLAAGCALTLPMELGLYTMVLESTRPSLAFQAGVAGIGVLSFVVMAAMLGLRNRLTHRLGQAPTFAKDPVTRLDSSTVIVQKIVHAQARRARTRRDGALMAVLMFEPERLEAQVGQAGMNDVYIQLARRMLRHTGAVNPAGRYYDRCFVVLIETLHSPRWIRTLGLRVASSLRKPIEVQSPSGGFVEIKPDIGVGIVHMAAAGKNVSQLLHEAESIAHAARGMRSRAALLDPQTRLAVPVESAELGDSWRTMKFMGAKKVLQARRAPSVSESMTRPAGLKKVAIATRRRGHTA